MARGDATPTPEIRPENGADSPASGSAVEAAYRQVFAMQLGYGYCVGTLIPTMREAEILTRGPDAEPVRSPLDIDWPIPVRGLTVGERSRATELRGFRRPDYIAGRLALRAALAHLGTDADTVGTDDRGAPMVPDGWVGSISHKRPFAIALAAPADGWTLGVDLEKQAPTSTDIARRVLTEAEMRKLRRDHGHATPAFKLAVIRHFSIKEAIYKAIDPFARRYVGFREVTVTLPPEASSADGRDGGIEVAVSPHLDPPPPRPLQIRARVVEFRDHYISSARARLRNSSIPGTDGGDLE